MSPGAIFAVRVVIALLGGAASWGLAAWRGDSDPESSAAMMTGLVLVYGMVLSGMEARRARNHNIDGPG